MKDRNKRPLFQYLEGFGGVKPREYRRYRMAGVRPSGKLEGV